MKFSVVIPARYASTRLPGKPLLDIGGRPMLDWVYEVARASGAETVIIATDDERIRRRGEALGARVCMTDPALPTGTDRIEQTVRELRFAGDEVVVNLQADEPAMPASLVRQVAELLDRHPRAAMSTLMQPIDSAAELFDPNVVKVVCGEGGRALYFSRAPVPWARDEFAEHLGQLPAGKQFFRHLGIYAYRVDFLHRFVTWPLSTAEAAERLEQLRALEQGAEIRVARACAQAPPGVDSEEDLDAMRRLLG